jgi:hypothetical protein
VAWAGAVDAQHLYAVKGACHLIDDPLWITLGAGEWRRGWAIAVVARGVVVAAGRSGRVRSPGRFATWVPL